MSEARVIKKYENRRLYDTEESRYVNLEEVSALIRGGAQIQVVDAIVKVIENPGVSLASWSCRS